MTRFITVPTPVVPLLYSGIELVVWGLDGELEQAFPTRSENHTWYVGRLGVLTARASSCACSTGQRAAR